MASLPPEQLESLLREAAEEAGLPEEFVPLLGEQLVDDWEIVGRAKQQPPDWGWTYWFLIAGRGFGKTLTAAQWCAKMARQFVPSLAEPECRFALVAPTLGDVRDTMVEGVTGLLSVFRPEELRGGSRETAWNRSLLELRLANDVWFKGFSSEKPDRLRGPQHHYAWVEELSSLNDAASGDKLESTWSNCKLGCRLGVHPQTVITSTPKPNKLTKEVLSIPGTRLAITRGSSYENRANLPDAWWEEVVTPLEGTRTGRQEIHAELIEDVEGALWTHKMIDDTRTDPATTPKMSMIGVGVDPNASSDEAANSAGIIVAGKGHSDRHGYVLADRTIDRGGPAVWAQAAVDAYHEFEADFIVAEKNNGGEMVEMVIKNVDPSVVVKLVSATRGKRTRAEPIAILYQEPNPDSPPRVHHAGVFPDLEEEQCSWTPEMESPDRMDAAVWILTKLEIWRAPGRGMRTSVPRGRIRSVDDRHRIA